MIVLPILFSVFSFQWNAEKIGIDAPDEHTQKLAMRAASQWSRASRHAVKFERGSGIVIRFAPLPEEYYAYTLFSLSGNEVVGATILIDPDRASSDSALSMVLLHELGHALGIDHSTVWRSVMFKFLKFSRLQPDDVAAIRFLYRKGSP